MGRFMYLLSVTENPDPSDSVIEDQPVTFDIAEDKDQPVTFDIVEDKDQPVTFDIVEDIPTEFKGRINLSHLI